MPPDHLLDIYSVKCIASGALYSLLLPTEFIYGTKSLHRKDMMIISPSHKPLYFDTKLTPRIVNHKSWLTGNYPIVENGPETKGFYTRIIYDTEGELYEYKPRVSSPFDTDSSGGTLDLPRFAKEESSEESSENTEEDEEEVSDEEDSSDEDYDE